MATANLTVDYSLSSAYWVNSPDLTLVTTASSSSSTATVSRRVTSSSCPSPSSPNSLALPPLPVAHQPFSALVLSSPDPSEAVPISRASVQISSGGPVNWSRPLPHSSKNTSSNPTTPTTASPTTPNFPTRSPMRHRTISSTLGAKLPFYRDSQQALAQSQAQVQEKAQASPASSFEEAEPLTPLTPPLLPPGAAAAMCPPPSSWTRMADGKGLGMMGVPALERSERPAPSPETKSRTSSRTSSSSDSLSDADSSDKGCPSVSSSSTSTSASTSGPTTPTRIAFMSDTLEAFSYPTTLEELRQLRAQAAELDIETKRLRRLRGREPATSPRLLPRKKVPVVTEIDLQEQPKPLPRRQAIRHSLITPLAGQNYSFAEPIGLGVPSAPAVGMSGGINRSAFATPAAASRRPFYAQGKAAMSVIEFSSRHKEEQAQAGPTAAPSFFSGRSRNFTGVVPTLSSLRRDKEGLSISTVAPIPEGATQEPSSAKENVPVQSPVTVTPPSSTDTVERIGFVSVKGPGFLGRHKKLSRFLGKPQAA